MPLSDYDFVAVVLEDTQNGKTKVEMRNKFVVNSELELLSKTKNNAIINIEKIVDEEGNELTECKVPKQVVFIYTKENLVKNEILRRKK